MKRRASLQTHGCRLNQAESDALRETLVRAGYQIVPLGEPADLGVINTCTVTREAEAKCRQTIRRFIRANPHAFTAVIGCYSQTGAKALADIGGVDLIIGNQDKLDLLDYVTLGKNERPVILRDRIDRSDFTVSVTGEPQPGRRPNLKVQDGCDFMCAFCIIPFARGRARSRKFDNLVAEAHALSAGGAREVVLTGVNIGTYNSGGRGICEVVDALASVPGLRRVRISSIEPTTVPEGIIDRMADPGHPLVPYLHLPLQSGSDRVLGRMRRRYSRAGFASFAEAAASRVPGLCLGTDILVGHPGERPADFDRTCRFFLDLPFAYAHVFPYSERGGTPAARDRDPVPVPRRQGRAAALRRLSAKKRFDFYSEHLGTAREVLFECQVDGAWTGYTDNFIRVRCPAPAGPGTRSGPADQLATVHLDRAVADFAEGHVVGSCDPARAG